jgi:hypothetical protein
MDTFRVNAAVVPRQEQQAFIPIYAKTASIHQRRRPGCQVPLVRHLMMISRRIAVEDGENKCRALSRQGSVTIGTRL